MNFTHDSTEVQIMPIMEHTAEQGEKQDNISENDNDNEVSLHMNIGFINQFLKGEAGEAEVEEINLPGMVKCLLIRKMTRFSSIKVWARNTKRL